MWENSRCSILFHLEVPGGKWQHGDLQPGLHGQGCQLGFPRPGAVAVGTARVRGDQQPPGLRVVAAPGGFPPAADRFDGERGGVVVGADADPAGVGGDVIDPVRHRLAQAVLGEVVRARGRGLALGPPLPARVLELADQFLLLGVHADHRIGGALMVFDLLVDVTELRVPVRVPLALDGLGVALQAEPLLPQQVTDGVGADPVTLAGQFCRQLAGRLHRPPQRRHRITPLIRLDQGQQRRAQPRVQVGRPLASPAGPAGPAQRLGTRVQLIDSQRHRGLADPGGPGHRPDPAVPQRTGLGPHQQPPLPLIQMREDRLELRRQHLSGFLHGANTTPTRGIPGSYGLFFCKLLAGLDGTWSKTCVALTRHTPGRTPHGQNAVFTRREMEK